MGVFSGEYYSLYNIGGCCVCSYLYTWIPGPKVQHIKKGTKDIFGRKPRNDGNFKRDKKIKE